MVKNVKVLDTPVVVGEKSARFALNKTDALKILKGAGIAVGGSLATYLLGVVGLVDWGQSAYMIIPVASVLLNAIIKYCSGQSNIPPL